MYAARRHFAAAIFFAIFFPIPLFAQQSQPAAVEVVRQAVASELKFAETDKSIWTYRDRDDSPERRALYQTVETRQGSLRRLLELNGQTLSPEAARAEDERLLHYVHDEEAQAKARKNGAHDDAQAAEMLKMLPEAFLWTIDREDSETVTLHYAPNPGFQPPDMQSRVMGTMGGEMIVVKDGHRIRTLKGHLTQDVKFGYGLFGRLNQGGTFDIERRMVGEGHWQITESHVHIGGKALLFKTIGQQSDEVKTDWKPSPAETLEAAAHVLGVQ
jgi:hypothetical protein